MLIEKQNVFSKAIELAKNYNLIDIKKLEEEQNIS